MGILFSWNKHMIEFLEAEGIPIHLKNLHLQNPPEKSNQSDILTMKTGASAAIFHIPNWNIAVLLNSRFAIRELRILSIFAFVYNIFNNEKA